MSNKFSISLETAKEQLVIEHDEDDSLITSYLEAAVENVLDRIGLGGVLGTTRKYQTTSLTSRIGHPVGETVDSVKKQNCSSGTCFFGEIDSEDYELTAVDDLFKCLTITDDEPGLYEVTYTIGLSTIPAPLRQAALFLLTHYYENRGAVVVGQGVSATPLPEAVETLIVPYRSIFVV